MSQIDEDLLRKLAEKLKKASAEKMVTVVEEIIHDKPFIDSDGRLKEPFRTVLLLRILGYDPVHLLLALHYIWQYPENSLPRLVEMLGPKVKEGNPRVRIKGLLTCLQKLGVLKAEEVKPKGVPTTKFSLDKLELHLFNESIHDILSGKEFDWSRLDIASILDKEQSSKFKVKNFDGTVITFRPLDMFESIIRYGAPTSVAWQAVSTAKNGIFKGECADLQTINKVILEELKKLYPESVAAFLKDNPLGLTLSGGDYDGNNLTYVIMEQTLEKFLSQYKMTCLPSKLHDQIVVVSLTEAMRDIRAKSELEASKIPDILKFSIFKVYAKSIDDVISCPSRHFEKSRWFLREAKDKLVSEEPNLAAKPLLCSLSCCLTALCLSVGLLPEKDESSTALLVKNLLSSSKEAQVKPLQFEKNTADQTRRILSEQNIDPSELVKCIDSIVSVDNDRISGIRVQDPSFLRKDLEYACSFADRVLSSIERAWR